MPIFFDKNAESNKNEYIEILNANKPIKISIYDLIKTLENDSSSSYEEDTISVGSSSTSTSTSTSLSSSSTYSSISTITSTDFRCIDGVTKHKDEPNDEYVNMDDEELIINVERLLIESKKNGIEDYYRKNNLKYRVFNLTGLYSKKFGIKSEKQRYHIRDLCRTCNKYLKNRIKEIRMELEAKEKILNKKKKEQNDFIIDYDKACTNQGICN